MRIDARIPVRFIQPRPSAGRLDQALLLPEAECESPAGWLAVVRIPAPAGQDLRTGHEAGCPCCTPRPAQAAILTRLFQARARGEIGFFRGVVASLPAAEAASLRDILQRDPYLSGCFTITDQ